MAPQDSSLPQDATSFTLSISRSFNAEVRKRTDKNNFSAAPRAKEPKLLKFVKSKVKDSLQQTAGEIRYAREQRDAMHRDMRSMLPGRLAKALEPTPPSSAESHLLESHPVTMLSDGRDLGNVFMARLVTGYGNNTITVSDVGISATNNGKEQSFRWEDVTSWWFDEHSLRIFTSAQATVALPADQIPADQKGRMLEYLGHSAPK